MNEKGMNNLIQCIVHGQQPNSLFSSKFVLFGAFLFAVFCRHYDLQPSYQLECCDYTSLLFCKQQPLKHNDLASAAVYHSVFLISFEISKVFSGGRTGLFDLYVIILQQAANPAFNTPPCQRSRLQEDASWGSYYMQF